MEYPGDGIAGRQQPTGPDARATDELRSNFLATTTWSRQHRLLSARHFEPRQPLVPAVFPRMPARATGDRLSSRDPYRRPPATTINTTALDGPPSWRP